MTIQTIFARWQMRRKTAAQWALSNEVLRQGEKGFETDTGKEKNGDGVTGWNGLSYAGGGGGGSGANLSIANRTASTLDVVSDTGTDATIPAATTSLAGLLSSADKTTINALPAASQPLDADLTAIAALTTTTFGRSFLDRADAAAGRALLGLGTLATQDGTFSAKQDALVSGTNIKTLNGASLLGSGNISTRTGSVTITGTTTVTLANDTIYLCSATSSAYTITLDTSAMASGDELTLAVSSTTTNLITFSCAAGLAGQTTRVGRDGESFRLRWNGATFDRIGGLNRPFIGGLNSTSASTVTTGAENRITLNRAITGLNPGYGLVVTTSNGSLVVPRTGRYKLKIALRVDGSTLASNANRIYAFFRLNATAGTYLNNSEASVLAGSYAFVPGDSPVVLNAGDVLTLYCGTSVSFNNAVGGGDFDNTWVSIEEIPPW